MKKVVVIGGGSGIFNVLKGLKNYPVEITSVVTTFDSGGSTGLLRDEFGTLPSGDIRRSIVALAPDTGDSSLRDLFNYRFDSASSLKGHSFGNLFLQALSHISQSEIGAIKKASELLNIKGRVLPISLDNSHLCAELESGEIIEGETNIDVPKHDGRIRIKKIFLKPKAIICEDAYDAIKDADLIIIGPGDLYTSILPNLIVAGFNEALRKSKAKILYITNIMTKWGETHDFKASDFARVLTKCLKKPKIDYLICNSKPLSMHLIKLYKKEKSSPVVVDEVRLKKYAKEIICEDVINQSEIVRHDAKKISRLIMQILMK